MFVRLPTLCQDLIDYHPVAGSAFATTGSG